MRNALIARLQRKADRRALEEECHQLSKQPEAYGRDAQREAEDRATFERIKAAEAAKREALGVPDHRPMGRR